MQGSSGLGLNVSSSSSSRRTEQTQGTQEGNVSPQDKKGCSSCLSECCNAISDYFSRPPQPTSQDQVASRLLESAQRSEVMGYGAVESKGESKETQIPIISVRFEVVGNPDIFPPDAKGQQEMGFVEVAVKLKVNILPPEGMNEEDVFIKEMEVDGVAQGDYIAQTLSPLSGLPNLEHSPNPKAIRVSAFFDNVSTMITTNDSNKPFNNGSLRWKIPVLFENKDGENIGQTTIVQEYTINNGLLTMFKGGQELLRLQLG